MEALEDRAVPALVLIGNETTLEGANYALSLDDDNPAGVIEYQIDWGDGSAIQTVAAAEVPGVFTHLYADGTIDSSYEISVQSIVNAAGPSADASYFFEGTGDAVLAEANGGTPLTQLGTGSAVPGETVNGETTQVWQFGLFSGFSLNMDVLSTPTQYTIEVVFQFDNVNAWRKILDFDNLSQDAGLYVFSNALQLNDADLRPEVGEFYEVDDSGTLIHRYNRVVMTRTVDGLVQVYLNGVEMDGGALDTYQDAGNFFDIAAGTVNFFVDDTVTGQGETSSGKVAQIRVFNAALSAAEVEALGSGGGTTVGASDSLDVQVDNVAPVYTAAPDQSGRPASFDLGSFTDAGLLDGPWSVTVFWGDGLSESFDVAEQGALSHSHDYAKNGKYTVTVTVTDKDGGVASGSFQVHVKGNPNQSTSAIEAASNEVSGPGNSGAQIDWNSLAAHVFGGRK